MQNLCSRARRNAPDGAGRTRAPLLAILLMGTIAGVPGGAAVPGAADDVFTLEGAGASWLTSRVAFGGGDARFELKVVAANEGNDFLETALFLYHTDGTYDIGTISDFHAHGTGTSASTDLVEVDAIQPGVEVRVFRQGLHAYVTLRVPDISGERYVALMVAGDGVERFTLEVHDVDVLSATPAMGGPAHALSLHDFDGTLVAGATGPAMTNAQVAADATFDVRVPKDHVLIGSYAVHYGDVARSTGGAHTEISLQHPDGTTQECTCVFRHAHGAASATAGTYTLRAKTVDADMLNPGFGITFAGAAIRLW